MSSEQPSEKEIFNIARSIAFPEARDAYLRQVCGDDLGLLDRVNALLEGLEKQESFLELPAVGLAQTASSPVIEKAGSVVGLYKLLQQIGEGGFGVVYMAEQTEPVRRKVALKVIKPGMDTKEVIARFEAERQALALMDHPNIAKVLDAGATQSSRPYFVMELVKGVPLTEYCDRNHVPTRDRLKLFVDVCHAIQHAHQKGVIHRDLKPSNIMVTLHDGKPVPKVIDFGVSKALSQLLTAKTLFTAYGQMIGTPAYMSPEQAEMSGLDIDTRSDVYSLGVLLYELLTGQTPLELKRLREAGYAEMQRIICEEEPVKPSKRLTTLGKESSVVSQNRGTDPKHLGQIVRGDLDWIVMRALEKDRNRRYETANGFAADIQRFLRDDPVTACPPSTVYRFRKFARRNQAMLATSAILAFALLGGTIISSWQAIRANRQSQRAFEAERLAQERLHREQEALAKVSLERDRALAAEAKAEERFQIAENAVKRYLNDVTRDPHLQKADFRELRTRLLESAVPFYEELIRQKPEDDNQRMRQAQAHFSLAVMYGSQFSNDEAALGHLKQSIKILDKLSDSASDQGAVPFWLANSLNYSSIIYERLGDDQQSTEYCEQALGIMRRLASQYSEVDLYKRKLSWILGHWAEHVKDLAEASRTLREAIELAESALREHPEDRHYRSNLAWWLCRQDDFEARKRSLAIREGLVKEFPKMVFYREHVGRSLASLGDWCFRNEKLSEAIDFHTSALEVRKELVDAMPIPLYVRHLSETHTNLAIVLSKKREWESAVDHHSHSIKLTPGVSKLYKRRADCYRNMGMTDAALDDLNQALQLDPENWGAIQSRASLHIYDSEQYQDGIADCNRLLNIKPQHAIAFLHRATAFRKLEEHESAVRDAVKAIKIQPSLAWGWEELMRIAELCQSPEELVALDDLYRQVEENPDEFVDRSASLQKLARIHAALGKNAENPEGLLAEQPSDRRLALESANHSD